MKDIKDYLHLYLGCEVELDNGGSTVVKKLVAVGGVDDGDFQYCQLRIGSPEKGHVHAVLLKDNRIKILLRPLSDIREEEKNEFIEVCGLEPEDVSCIVKEPDDFFAGELSYGTAHLTNIAQWAVGTNWLRKKGFDIDELIESGLAIDKTKL